MKIVNNRNVKFIDLSNGEQNLSSSSLNDYKNSLSSPKNKTTTPVDLQLSNTTRLESLKLINEAFRRFTNLESTLSTQRKQSQTTSTINSNRSKYNKNNKLIINETQS
jgi:hypothetical protein